MAPFLSEPLPSQKRPSNFHSYLGKQSWLNIAVSNKQVLGNHPSPGQNVKFNLTGNLANTTKPYWQLLLLPFRTWLFYGSPWRGLEQNSLHPSFCSSWCALVFFIKTERTRDIWGAPEDMPPGVNVPERVHLHIYIAPSFGIQSRE